jgi:uracil-DNA glycosylase
MMLSLPDWPTESTWTEALRDPLRAEDFQKLHAFLEAEREQHAVFPPAADVFNAFRLTDYEDVKVVILGQDPYHGPGQAHGLSFSVSKNAVDAKYPPSLRNIFKELQTDLGCAAPATTDLESWARQGVFLLNTVLTVRQAEANSHRKRGWETFTDEVIRQLSARSQPVVFILWGKPAQAKADLIDGRHTVLTAPHPSPLSAHRGFFGSRPFSKSNAALIKLGQAPIDWASVCNRR